MKQQFCDLECQISKFPNFQISKFLLLILLIFSYDVGWGQVVCQPCELNPDPENFGAIQVLDPQIAFYPGSTGGNNTPNYYDTPTSAIEFNCTGAATTEIGNGTGRLRLLVVRSELEPLVRSEGFFIELCEPIHPNMRGTIRFRATTAPNCNSQAIQSFLRIDFSNGDPVAGAYVYDNPGMVASFETQITNTPNTNPAWGNYEIPFHNTTGVCWNYVFVSGIIEADFGTLGHMFVDDISIRLADEISQFLDFSAATAAPFNPCLGSTSTVTVNVCNNIPNCDDGTPYIHPGFNVVPNLPAGLSLVGSPNLNVALGEIPFGQCKTLTFSVMVDNNMALDGQALPITFNVQPTSPCYVAETIPGTTIVPEFCPPPITCTCPPGSSVVSINPGLGVAVNYSTLGLPATISNKCVELNGLLNLDTDLTLDNVTVVTNSGSLVNIQQGKTLSANSTSFGSCDQMWRGIKVNAGAKLVLSGTMALPSSIRDAQYAIQAVQGSSLSVSWTQFDKNYIGVQVPAASTTSTVALTNTIPFNQCTFTCSSDLLPAYIGQFPTPGTRGLYAFDLNNVNGFNIGSAATGILSVNGLRNGLRANSSVFSIKGATMSNFTGASANNWEGVRATNCKSATVERCTINNYRTGVFAQGCNVSIKNNTLNAFAGSSQTFQDIGIFLRPGSNKRTEVTGNTIKLSEIGIKIQTLSAPLTNSVVKDNIIDAFEYYSGLNPIAAIWLAAVNGMRFYNNTMGEKTGTLTTGHLSHIGIYANDCPGNTFFDNKAYSMRVGYLLLRCRDNYLLNNVAEKSALITNAGTPKSGFVQEVGGANNHYCCNAANNIAEDGFNFQQGCLGTNFNQQQIGTAGVGLRLGQFGSANVSNITIIGEQIEKQNRWLGTYATGFGARHESDMEEIISASQFKASTNATFTPNWTTGLGNLVSWFIPGQPSMPQACNCPPPPAFGGTGDDRRFSTDGTTADGAFNTPYADLFNWEAQRNLYGRLKDHYTAIVDAPPPSGLTSTELAQYNATTTKLSQFYTDATTNNGLVKQYQDLETAIGLLAERSATQQADLAQQFATVKQWADSLAYLSTQPQSAANDALQAQARAQLQNAADQYEVTLVNIAQLQGTERNQLYSTNTALGAIQPFQNKEKAIHALYLQGRFFEPEPSAPNWTAIKAIADLCAYKYGPAVHTARTLYLRFEPNYYWSDESICPPISQERKDMVASIVKTSSWVLTPNPADDHLRLFTTIEAETEIQFRVFGAMGNLVSDILLPVGTQGKEISSAQWPNGVYYYQLIGSNRLVQAGQVLISH